MMKLFIASETPIILARNGRDENLINVSSAKFLKTLALRHIEACFCRLRNSVATSFLMSVAFVTRKPWSKVLSSDCNFSCTACKRPRFWELVGESPASIALDLSNKSDRFLTGGGTVSSTRCFASANRSCELASLETARSLPRLRIKPIMAHTNMCTWPWLCFCSWKGLLSRGFVQRLVPLAPHRQTHSLVDRIALPSQMEVFFFFDHAWHSMTPMNRPSCRTFKRKHLRVGSRPWGRRSSRASHRNTRTRPSPGPRLGSCGSGFFCFKISSS